MVLHVLECSSILIYVLYKSRSLTLVTMICIVGMFYEYCLWAQVVVLFMLSIILDSWDICVKYNAGAQEVIFTQYSRI